MKKIKLLNLVILVAIIFFVGKLNISASPVTTNESNEEVEVPDTLDGRTALLLSFAMFDIALGIGIVTYVKKNKITE